MEEQLSNTIQITKTQIHEERTDFEHDPDQKNSIHD